MKSYQKRALEIYNSGVNLPTDIAKELIKEGAVTGDIRSIRKNISNWIRKGPVKANQKEFVEKPFVLSAWNEGGYMMDIDEYCENYALPRKDVRKYKLVSHTGTPFYNIEFKERVDIEEDIFSIVIDRLLKGVPDLIKVPTPITTITDRLIWTDVHVGMDASRKGLAQYASDWNLEELKGRIAVMISTCIAEKQSEVLIVDDLGDFMDGWNGETTRGGHKLPQNMTNEEAFDAGLTIKMILANELSKHWNYVTFNNICEDNHAGAFGYIVNSAFKRVCDATLNNVVVVNHQKFMSHYTVGRHAIVITHGKDSRSLKFGFKPQIDSKQIEKIDQFLKNEGIYKTSDFVEFGKGDSHQCLFDMASSDDFDYFNYPAFSPSSEWVQVNFKRGRSAFCIQHIHHEINRRQTDPFWF
tara:strand:- start:2957 stop:4192 length:1236 start_codon:yes stop_codon:yes gene_type:complete